MSWLPPQFLDNVARINTLPGVVVWCDINSKRFDRSSGFGWIMICVESPVKAIACRHALTVTHMVLDMDTITNREVEHIYSLWVDYSDISWLYGLLHAIVVSPPQLRLVDSEREQPIPKRPAGIGQEIELVTSGDSVYIKPTGLITKIVRNFQWIWK